MIDPEQAIHTRDQPRALFRCDVCGAVFSVRSEMHTHIGREQKYTELKCRTLNQETNLQADLTQLRQQQAQLTEVQRELSNERLEVIGAITRKEKAQRERDAAEADLVTLRQQLAETQRESERMGKAIMQGNDPMADEFRIKALEAQLAETQQARDHLKQQLLDVDDALDGQFPSTAPCVARAVQQQRIGLDAALNSLTALQQAITGLGEQWRTMALIEDDGAAEHQIVDSPGWLINEHRANAAQYRACADQLVALRSPASETP